MGFIYLFIFLVMGWANNRRGEVIFFVVFFVRVG